MFKAPLSHSNEARRLAALHSYDVLGEGQEHELDNLVKLAVEIAQVSMGYVSFVDERHVILKSMVGLETDYRKLDRGLTVCQHTMLMDTMYVSPDVALDANLTGNPLLQTEKGPVRFYASAPLVDADGYALGCLCLLDDVPRRLEPLQLQALQTLAVQVMAQLALKRKNSQLEAQTQKYNEFIDIFTISPEIHCILDRKGDILFINDAVTHLLGYTVEETIGKNMWQYCYRDDIDRTVNAIESGLAQGIKNFANDFRLISKHNQLRWIGWRMVSKGDRWFCYGRDITESKQVENELMRLSVVANKINNGVAINDADNRIVWVNNAFENITGFTLNEVKGKRLADLISGPGTDHQIVDGAREKTRLGQSFSVDMLAYRKDKTPIWISVHNTLIADEEGQAESEVEIIIDITARKKAEQELEVLSLVASKTHTGVTIANSAGEITWVNTALSQLTGYSLEELSGKLLGDVLSDKGADRTLILEARQKALKKEAYSIEVQAHKKDGEAIWLSVSNTPVLNDKGEIERQVELINDITQRKQVEREMLESREQALQLSEAKEMFLSVMSHEIRTPLNAVIGMTHLLLDNDPKESQLDDLNILKFSSENLLHIINDILDFTKIETGNLHLEMLPFDLHTLSVDIINSLQINAGKNGNQLLLQYDDHIPPVLLGDKTRLYQVLMNLLGNAIKFTDGGRVTLSVMHEATDAQTVKVRFEVRDTGIGIPKEKQSYIFEVFTQAKGDIARKYGGTGLGLAITKRLLKLYGADIDVQSAEGQGTTFSFMIAFAQPGKGALPAPQAPETRLFKNKSVLLVDDNEVNILIAKRFLGKWGLNIDFVTNGEDAIKKVWSKKYDLVFMDIRMPGIDGFETTRIIRDINDEYFKKLPIVALTASTLHNEHQKFKDSGMNGHVLKPFNPDEIKAVLQQFLSEMH